LLGAGVGALDIDKCRDATTGAIAAEAMVIVKRAASYVEITPSGTGLRVIGYGVGDEAHRKQKIGNGSPVEIESYRNTGRYITVSGKPLNTRKKPGLVNIDAVIDGVVAELDGAEPESDTTGGRVSLDEWIAANGKRYEADGDFRADDSNLPPRLMALLRNSPPAKDLSDAFHHAVNWLHDLGWSARKIQIYIESAPVVPQRYEDRLDREVYRCLHKADFKKAEAKARAAQPGGLGLGRGRARTRLRLRRWRP
jgi:hypothetical protein